MVQGPCVHSAEAVQARGTGAHAAQLLRTYYVDLEGGLLVAVFEKR